MEFEFLVDGVIRKISLEKKNDILIFRDGEMSFEADIRPVSENSVSILVDGRSYLAYIVEDKDKKLIWLGGRQVAIREPGQGDKAFHKGEEKTQEAQLRIAAPMPGKVIKINVAEGEEVRKNQTLVIVEAMKMENEIKSSIDAVVKKIYAAAGELVDSEKPLIELELKK